MIKNNLSEDELRQIEDLVNHYIENKHEVSLFLEMVNTLFTRSSKLTIHLHTMKSRIKDPDHLRDKLIRKLIKCKEESTTFNITKENLFEEINDLAGYRLLHLHTSQFDNINTCLKEVLDGARYILREGPIAYTWDDETEKYFIGLGVKTEINPRMYTSVHYVIESNSRKKYTCEIQVRTLAEELWGEVDHKINYPIPSEKLACKEQIRVLARVASSCTRLVDSIFKTHELG